MGTWGPSLYSDDDARDVRESFRDHLGDGLDAVAATEALLAEWGTLVDDPDSTPFWLALADTQWKLGRVVSHVRERALAILESGDDLRRWQEDPKGREKRRAVLADLRAQLTSPAPEAKRIAKRFRSENDWAVGEIVAVELPSGRYAILRTLGHHEDQGGRSPVCELLEWRGGPGDLPGAADLVGAGILRSARHGGVTQILLGATSSRELAAARVRRLGINSPPSQEPRRYTGVPWRAVNALFEKLFGLT